jgi:hypothetical protein
VLHKLKGHSPATFAALGAWKLRQTVRHVADRAGASSRLLARSRGWEREFLRDHGENGIAEWLARPGAGRFWFEPADAGEWARTTHTPEDAALAADSAAGVFRILGAPATAWGTRPEWRRDLYSGVEWPLVPSSRIQLVRGDGSDIRTVWELSRGYHFIALARAWAAGHEDRYALAFARDVDTFIEQNPLGSGPHWASPMDVAIRSANWALAVPLFARAPVSAGTWARMLAYLRAGGRHLERHLEWHPIFRGNHYVANAVGLVYLGTLFRGTRDGDRWLRTGSRILQQEIRYQVHADGVSFEASLAYHRLVTELFGWAAELLRRNDPTFPAADFDARLAGMYRFIEAYLQPDGQAPLIGDADDGRLHLVSAAARLEPRRHALGLAPHEARLPDDGAFPFPGGGFHVLRDGADHAVIRCGTVGLRGAGSHDHNDQLSFELVVAGRRVVADSGTFVYTRDLRTRHAFRSIAAHSGIQLGDEEPNPIAVAAPWRVLADRTRSRVLACAARGDTLVFAGQHHGYAHRRSAAVCRREVRFDRASRAWTIEDRIDGHGEEAVTWRLQLAPGAVVSLEATTDGSWRATIAPGSGGMAVAIDALFPAGMTLCIVSSPASEAYGSAVDRPVLEARGTVTLPALIGCTLAPLAAG